MINDISLSFMLLIQLQIFKSYNLCLFKLSKFLGQVGWWYKVTTSENVSIRSHTFQLAGSSLPSRSNFVSKNFLICFSSTKKMVLTRSAAKLKQSEGVRFLNNRECCGNNNPYFLSPRPRHKSKSRLPNRRPQPVRLFRSEWQHPNVVLLPKRMWRSSRWPVSRYAMQWISWPKKHIMTRRFVKMIYTIKNVITFDLGNCHGKK